MTITEKILARHAGRDRVTPGENIWIDVDILMTHDVCGPPTIDIFKREFGADATVWDRDKVVIMPDHYIFTANHHANRNVEVIRAFAHEQDLPHFYDVGTERYKGVCHIALAEEGFNRPGSVLIGTDSHTCTSGAFGLFSTGVGNTDAALIMGTGKIWVKVPETMRFVFEGKLPPYLMAKDLILAAIGDIGCDGATYRAMEFDGEAVYDLSMQERMTLTNMAIEAGGKNGVIAPDETTLDYVRARTDAAFDIVFTSYGVLPWLPDLDRWAKIGARCLKPGGTFYLVEFHPFVGMLDDAGERIAYPYFHRDEPLQFEQAGSYAEPEADFTHTAYEWPHSLGEIVTALLKAGLTLEYLHEFPYSTSPFPWYLDQEQPDRYVWKDRALTVPLMFSIKATR